MLAIVLVSPAALLCVLSGQSSFLTTAALLAIFAQLDKRPVLAGVLIGLLTVKPQLGILFPFALIASGRWRVFFAAGVTAVALFAASVALGGVESWHAYIIKALPLQREVLQDAAGTAMPFHPTIFMNIRGAGRQPRRRDHPARFHARRRRRRRRPPSAIAAMATRACCRRCSSPARCPPRPIWAPMICCR